MEISKDLSENIRAIKAAFADCGDIIMREFAVGGGKSRIFMVYTDNIVDGDTINDFIMTNLMGRYRECNETGILDMLMEDIIAIGEMGKITELEQVYDAVLLGDTVLLTDKSPFALQASTKNFPSRGVSQAETEVVVQGPKDAFLEVASTNIVLIRRRIRDTALKIKRKKIGSRSKTDVALLYIEDIVNEEVLAHVEKQLDSIKIKAVLDSSYIEQLLEKRWSSPFPQLQMTERPDKAAAALLEGRVVLVVDNTPFVVLLPVMMSVFFQSAEDYYDRWEMMSLIRIIRYCAAFTAVFLPAIYIALAVFHPDVIPTAVALKIASTRENIPFSVVGEVVIMELAFELLREAGIRLPSPVSSTMGIVGGIIIGSAAVEAGIVSPVVVIVSALTGVCTFVIPNVAIVSALRLSKYGAIILAAVFGLFGVWVGVLLLLSHLCGLSSYGIPFLYPFCSATVNDDKDWEDALFRPPLQKIKGSGIFSSQCHKEENKK